MLTAKLTRPSRQWLLALMVGLSVALALSMAFAGDAQAKKKHHHRGGGAPVAPPVVVADASCQVSSNGSVGADGNSRLAQTFTAVHSGVLSAAQFQAFKDSGTKGDWILQIGTVDQSTGVPDSVDNVLGSAIVPDSTLPDDATSTLTGTFTDPPSVVAGQRYALILIRPGSSNHIGLYSTTDPCGGSAFTSFTQTGSFFGLGGSATNDYIFATFVTI